MHQSDRKSERSLEPDDSIRGMRECIRCRMVEMRRLALWPEERAELIHLLRPRIVRRMISRDHVDRAVANRRVERFDIVRGLRSGGFILAFGPQVSAARSSSVK